MFSHRDDCKDCCQPISVAWRDFTWTLFYSEKKRVCIYCTFWYTCSYFSTYFIFFFSALVIHSSAFIYTCEHCLLPILHDGLHALPICLNATRLGTLTKYFDQSSVVFTHLFSSHLLDVTFLNEVHHYMVTLPSVVEYIHHIFIRQYISLPCARQMKCWLQYIKCMLWST